MDLPDFSDYEIDYSELIACEITGNNLLMQFNWPVSGWRWKRKLKMVLKFLGLKRDVFFYYTEFQDQLKLIWVELIEGTLSNSNGGISENIFSNGFPVLSDVRFVKKSEEMCFAYFEFDDGTLEITFRDCVQRQCGKA